MAETMMPEEMLVELERLNEQAKEVGNAMWERGDEWREIANTVYKGAKQLWIAQGILRRSLSVRDAPP